MLPGLPQVGEQVADYICAHVPEIRRVGVEETVLQTCRANTTMLLDYLVRGVSLDSFVPSAEVLGLTRAVVQQGLPLSATMRGYRVGAQHMAELWADAVGIHGREVTTAVATVKAGTTFILSWLEIILEALAEEYRSEDERLARERSLARVEDVRRVLDDPGADVDAVSTRLGYRLSGRHVALAVRDCTTSADAGASLDTAIRELMRAVGASHPLAVRVDMRTVWCWASVGPATAVRLSPPSTPVLVAVGRPASGVDGFRSSHRQALDGLRVAEIACRAPGTITYYDDVDIAAMCSADLDKCRQFMRTELGALAAPDIATQRQRETLAAFFAANSNYRATAAVLGIHHNTVRYRLEQAQLALGHSLTDRRMALELALHLHSAIGDQPGVP